MTASFIVERSPDVIFQPMAGEDGAVLLHLGTGQYHTLNPVGARIWQLIETPLRESELSRRLEAEFEADQAMLAADIQAFVLDLAQRKLIRRVAEQ